MTQDTIRIVEAILANPTDVAVVGALVAPDASYVSRNFENADLRKIMPWCDTRLGPQAIVDTFMLVRRYWQTLSFEITDVFGSDDKAAVFGCFTYRSVKLGRETSSPFAVLARSANGKLTHMQFMEDTFATAASFRLRGTWTFASDPSGDEVSIGDDEQEGKTMTQEEKAIADVLESYGQAANESDLEAVIALYAEDGALLAQESPTAIGREAVRAAYAGIFAAVRLDITFNVAEVRVLAPDWAFLRSTSSGTITIKANGATVPEGNQELFIFQKTGAGWKIARYAFSVTSSASTS